MNQFVKINCKINERIADTKDIAGQNIFANISLVYI